MVAGVVSLGFLAAACGSSGDSSANAVVATPEATPGIPEPSDATSPPDAPSTDAPSTDAPSDAPATDAPAGIDGDPIPTDAAIVVPEALAFTAPLVGGGEFDGAAMAGKPTVFWFWAPT